MRQLIIAFLFFIQTNAMSQQIDFINSRPVGYSDAVVVTGGKTIYVSGQVALSESGVLVGKGDLHAQTIQVFENLKRVLKQADATFQDVVKVNIYIVNCKPEDVALVRELRKNYLSASQPPASTLVGVTSLVNPDFLIEIEVVAVK
jgi:2-iminobutanoate/2-iminopropanoate deaminase